MGAFQNKVQDMVGSTYSVTAEDELFEAAVHEVADILPTEFLLKNATTPINITTSAGTDVKDSKVLFVERGSVPADLIEYSEFLIHTGISGSIYELETNSWPAYYVEPTGDGTAMLKILPVPTTPQKGKIWYFSYATNSIDLTAITAATLNTSYYLPSNVIHAIALKSCANILQSYISNQVQDEEDSEMLQMVEKQLQSIENQFKNEIVRFMDESGKPGSE